MASSVSEQNTKMWETRPSLRSLTRNSHCGAISHQSGGKGARCVNIPTREKKKKGEKLGPGGGGLGIKRGMKSANNRWASERPRPQTNQARPSRALPVWFGPSPPPSSAPRRLPGSGPLPSRYEKFTAQQHRGEVGASSTADERGRGPRAIYTLCLRGKTSRTRRPAPPAGRPP